MQIVCHLEGLLKNIWVMAFLTGAKAEIHPDSPEYLPMQHPHVQLFQIAS